MRVHKLLMITSIELLDLHVEITKSYRIAEFGTR